MKHLLAFVLFTGIAMQVHAQEAEADAIGDTLYRLTVRVIFADTTGIKGTVPRELLDISAMLKQRYDYGTYELWNTVRLQVFDGDHATALVFPDHYLTLTTRGETADGGLKAQVEIVHVPPTASQNVRVNVGRLLEDNVRIQLDEGSGEAKTLMPIVRSAALLEDDAWESFGGIPVRVTSQRQVSGNRLSTSTLTESSRAIGRERFLILAIQQEKD